MTVPIFVDNRETRSKIPPLLTKQNIPIEITHLDIGDYLILGSTLSACTSSKTAGDFMSSIGTEHLNQELWDISTAYDLGILLIHGSIEEAMIHCKVSRETYFHYIGGCISHRSPEGKRGAISVVNVTSVYDAVMLLSTLYRIIVTDDIYREPTAKRRRITEDEQCNIVVQSLGYPLVGKTRTSDLLTDKKTVKNIVNSTPDELQITPGIGPKIAGRIHEISNREKTIT